MRVSWGIAGIADGGHGNGSLEAGNLEGKKIKGQMGAVSGAMNYYSQENSLHSFNVF